MESDVLKFIETRRDEIISNLKELIKAKTENPPGDVTQGIEVIARILDEYHVDYRIVEPVKGKQNLIAVIGDESEKTLILNGHVDVVPAGEKWTYDPFGGKIEGNKIFGRGASDMKSGVISLLYAFLAHKEKAPGRVILSIVADEETGGKHGSRYLIENKIIVGDACIIAEPSGDLKTGKYKIVAGEKGVLWAKIICRGRASHGSLPMLGKNAIRELSKTITTLPEVFPTPVRIPEDAKDLIMNGKEWLNNVHPGAGDALDHYTLNIGIIRGGKKVNIVPDYCEIEIDMRIPIGTNSSDAENQLRTFLGTEHEIEIIDKIEPSYTSSSHPLTQAIRNVAEMFLGYAPPCVAMPATSDARLFRKAGIPTINFGPGFLEKAHTENEFVYITDVINFAKIYASFILHYFRERNS